MSWSPVAILAQVPSWLESRLFTARPRRFVFVSLMAPLVITGPTGVKLFINDSELAKVIVSEYLNRPRTPISTPADSIKSASTTIAAVSTDSKQAVSSPSESTLPLTKRNLQPLPRKRWLSGNNHMATDVCKDFNQSDSVAILVSASNRISSRRHPVQLSNRFDALASNHNENDSKPSHRKRVSGCIANMDRDVDGPGTRFLH